MSHALDASQIQESRPVSVPLGGPGCRAPFGQPRNFLQNRFAYVVISPRARGLSVGVNMNPDKLCNFDCLYCEVNRRVPGKETVLNVEAMAMELEQTLRGVHEGRLRELPLYSKVPAELLELRHVALSGDGEPTLCPQFAEAVQAVVHLRAIGPFPFFKIVLITNASGLDLPQVQSGLTLFTPQDEIWAKLDAGTQRHMDLVNRTPVQLEKVLANILAVARQRPVIIQTMLPALNDQEPPVEEMDQYCRRLVELKQEGAMIPMVQIYSATRPMTHQECTHLPLKNLSHLARRVREATGLCVEVF